LIVMLILRYLQLKATFGWSLSNLVALLRMNLFAYRDLWQWLNDPFEGPPLLNIQLQAKLQFQQLGQHMIKKTGNLFYEMNKISPNKQ